MNDWTAGYVADIGYTYGFYRELTPALLDFLALTRGKSAPDAGAPLTYCELGCGQGFSMNLLAAANPHIRFHATDFNPSQIAGARKLAAEARLENVTFHDHSFADFAGEPGLPDQFDIIALHGIYSWISRDNRATIVEFIRRKLKVGGLVYISYNCLPGWAAAAPMRHLMYLHGKSAGGPTISRVPGAIAFIDRMCEANAAYFAVPGLKERFAKTKDKDSSYLAHEYFNDAWHPFYHSEVAKDLDAAKLSYLGSAALLEQIDTVNFTPAQQEILAEIHDPVLRETIRDYMTNQQFRRDVFIKGPLDLSSEAARDTWLAQRFALSTRRQDIELKVKTGGREATLQEAVYAPLLDRLAEGPMTVRELVSEPVVANLGWHRLQQALVVLSGIGHVQPCLPEKDDSKRAKSTRAFNRAVMERARESADLKFLASPITGGGLAVGRIQQLFMLAIDAGLRAPADYAKYAWDLLSSKNQRLVKDGSVLETAEENLVELNGQAAVFAEKHLSLLRSLQVVQP